MPFSFSHPAAVLPVHSRLKKWIALPALVVGSIVPDMAYYLPMPEHFKENAHTLLGTFTSSLPVGILVLLLVYWIGEETVFLLPQPHCEALRGRLKVPALRLPEILLGVLGITIGAWTHVIWDSFTHEGTWVEVRVPLLHNVLIGKSVHGYDILQNLSSAVGLCVLLYVYDKWIKSLGYQPWKWRKPTWRLYLWPGVAAVCLVAAMIENHTVQTITACFFFIRGAGAGFADELPAGFFPGRGRTGDRRKSAGALPIATVGDHDDFPGLSGLFHWLTWEAKPCYTGLTGPRPTTTGGANPCAESH
jgi:hypothetical protein